MQRKPVSPDDAAGRPDTAAAAENAKKMRARILQSNRVRELTAGEDNSIRTAVWVAVIFIVCTLTAIISISVNRAHGTQGRDESADEAFGAASLNTPYIDQAALTMLQNVQQQLTAKCTPPDSFLSTLNMGSLSFSSMTLEQTQADWTAIVDYLRPNASAPDVGCLFFGQTVTQQRSGLTVSPVDYCHAMVSVGMTIFQINQNRTFPASIIDVLSSALINSYPLNMFLRFFPGGDISTTYTAPDFSLRPSVVYNIYDLILPYNQFANQPIDLRTIATSICNPYFASNALAHYQSALMPLLAFPFLGVLQRTGHTTFSNSIVDTLGSIDPLNITKIKKLYVFGDALADDPSASLLINSFFGTVPVDIVPAGEDISDRFTDVQMDTSAGTPVGILGRYAEDTTSYKSAVVDPKEVYIMLTTRDPDDVLVDEISLDILRGAYSSQAISVIDTTTDHAYERTFGADYKPQKDVAELLMLLAMPTFAINASRSSALAPTYALANVVVNGVDLTGNLAARLAHSQRLTRGRGSGFRELSFAGQMHTTYTAFAATDTASLPDKFSWRDHKPQCICAVENQGVCGGCWAFATKYSLASQFCVSGKTSTCPDLSAQHIISCAGDTDKDGCEGDNPNLAATFMAETGVLNNKCLPYKNVDSTVEKPCNTNCADPSEKTISLYFSTTVPALRQMNDAKSIKMELKTRGTLAAGFTLPPDFDSFFDSNPLGIYQMKASKGYGHLVELVGYDDTSNPASWECKNTWGKDFADKGYFRISQTDNTANLDYMVIENHVYVITPYTIKSYGTNVVPEPNNNDPDIIIDDNDGGKEVKEKPPKPEKNDASAGVYALSGLIMALTVIGLCILFMNL